MMALIVYWYDFVCFGIVVVAFVGSLYVLWKRELVVRRNDQVNVESIYESLLIAPDHHDEGVLSGALPTHHVGSTKLWTSCWKGVHPVWLFATRLGSFLVMAGFLAWDIVVWDCTIFVYYTEWTFALVMLYFALASVVSAYGCWMSLRKPLLENGTAVEFIKRDVQFRAGLWGYLMQAIYQTCGGAAIMTDIVFWCIIVPFGISTSHLQLNTLMGCMHTLNLVFLLIDTVLNSMPFPWFRIAYFVQWSCLYIVFQWVIHACGVTWWPYPFLELDVPWAPLWYFSLAVIHIPCYGAYALIVKAKNSFLPKMFPHSFLRSC